MGDPRGEYQNRLKARLEGLARKEREHIRAGNAKLGVVVAGLAMAWVTLKDRFFAAWWLAVPFLFFLALAIFHEQVIRKRTRSERAAAFYQRGIERMEDRWAGKGASGERFREAKHVYSDDLDIFGRGSLFELLSMARTPMGESRLAGWLTSAPKISEILERQRSAAELRERMDLREQLAVAGEELSPRLHPEMLVSWAESPRAIGQSYLRYVAAVLAVCFLATLIFYLATAIYWPLLVVIAFEAIVYSALQKKAAAAITGMSSNSDGLSLLAEILQELENEEFTSPQLQKIARNFRGTHGPASHAIQKLARIVNWIDARESLGAHLAEFPLLYTVQLGYAAEAWRQRWGSATRQWIDAVAELEALLSLAAYSYEHPGDPFPEFELAEDSAASFDGEDLGHPLIPAAQCVRNSVRLGKENSLLLISGSNMSGKSTLLRTVGVNAVLAMAGAPIRGKSLRLTPLSLGTSLRTTDSLQEGRSSFYTEILRIREVFDLSEAPRPLLFLFDELLEGTNSKDRRIGSQGILEALLGRRAIGMVTTHDLALTEITRSLGSLVRNMHFQDFVEDGKMRFDYILRDGVVTKSNALELMRLIGLKV
ncbi:MAG TPA: hypothetical protein VIC00_06870 [Candidatus Acidoferrales bacterium]